METKDILTSLAELETNLQAIKSAKQQVDDTIFSCQEIGKTAETYSVALEDISTTLGKVIDRLKERQDSIDTDATAIVQNFRKQCSTITEIQSDVVKGISETFKKDCNAVIEVAKNEFKKQTDNLDSTLSAKSLALTTSISNLNTEITKIESLYNLIKITFEGIKVLKNDVNQLDTTLSNSQTKQDEDLSAIKQQIDDFLKNVKLQFQSISQEIINSQAGQDAALSDISKAISDVNKKINHINSENKEYTTRLNTDLSHITSDIKRTKLFTITSIVGIVILFILLLVK